MTGRSAADSLVERGLDPAEHQAKRGLFDLVLAGCSSPRFVCWVPGRLEVFGKHTDYAGGRTLVCAVPRGFAVAARPRADGRVSISDSGRHDRLTIDPHVAGEWPSGWRNYVGVVVRRFARNFPGASIGADVVFASDLPSAAGMSSSSALVVAVASALARLADLESRAEWQANVSGELDAAGYYACLENGLSFGTLQGDGGVGTHGGSEDHAAILTARPEHVSAFSFVPMRRLADAELAREWRFVLAPSGVRAAKTGAAMESYNRLSHGARVLTELATAGSGASLASAIGAGGTEGLGRLRDRIGRSEVEGWPAPALDNRLQHFVREDARVGAAVDAFARRDRDVLSWLAAESQQDAEALLGNQVPETIALVRAATALGAFAASSFGAGFGGSVWALVDADRAADFAARWHPRSFVVTPGPPLTEIGP